MNIALTVFGKRGYFYAAYNLAASIKKFTPDTKILLIHDSGLKYLAADELKVFDIFHPIDESITHPNGMLDAGYAKLCVYPIATKYFKEYLFMDVDALSLKDLSKWYADAKGDGRNFLTDVRGKGGKSDVINYSVWATNEDIWDQFKLKDSDTFQAIQSSWHFARKSKEATSLIRDAINLNGSAFVDRTKLLIKWGKNLPDELVMGGAIARAKMDVKFAYEPIYFPNKHLSIAELRAGYYVLSMFGNGRGANTMVKADFKEFYDRFLRNEVFGHQVKYKNSVVMRDKMIG